MNMFRWRFTIDAQPRSKNGQPPQSTTGVASASSIQFSAAVRARRAGAAARAGSSATMTARIGAVSAERHQKRRVMSSSSGFASSSSVTVARLERHAADRARAGPISHDLRVHRARVLGFDIDRSGGAQIRIEELLRVRSKLLEAALGAEVVGLPVVVDVSDRVGGSIVIPQTGSRTPSAGSGR